MKGVLRPFLAKTGVFLVFLEMVMFSGERAWPVLLCFMALKSKDLGTSCNN